MKQNQPVESTTDPAREVYGSCGLAVQELIDLAQELEDVQDFKGGAASYLFGSA